MSRLSLPQVTLVAIDTRAPALAAQSMARSMAQVDFGRALLFTHGAAPGTAAAGIEIVEIDPIRSGAAYSHFVLRQLADHVGTSHALITQWDGFVLDGAAWRDEFLAHDYIGAVWDDQPPGLDVGNGGFSLRSARMLRAGQDPRIVDEHPEDAMLCRRYRALLEREHGIRVAPAALARHFAFENIAPRGPVFGFHGPYHLPRVLDEATLSSWLDALPDGFFLGRDGRRLARALLRHGMLDAARQLLRRRASAGSADPKTRWLGAVVEVMARLRRSPTRARPGGPG